MKTQDWVIIGGAAVIAYFAYKTLKEAPQGIAQTPGIAASGLITAAGEGTGGMLDWFKDTSAELGANLQNAFNSIFSSFSGAYGAAAGAIAAGTGGGTGGTAGGGTGSGAGNTGVQPTPDFSGYVAPVVTIQPARYSYSAAASAPVGSITPVVGGYVVMTKTGGVSTPSPTYAQTLAKAQTQTVYNNPLSAAIANAPKTIAPFLSSLVKK